MLLKVSKIPEEALLENAQKVPLKFAFANIKGDTVKVLHQPVLCRDFLLDTLIWFNKEDKYSRPIYGYKFTGPINEQPTLFLKNVKNVSGLSKLHRIEKIFSAEPSELLPTEKKDSYVIVGDNLWQKNTTLLSFWTFCQRYFLGTNKYSLTAAVPEEFNFFSFKKIPTFIEVAKILSKLPVNGKVMTGRKSYSIHGPNGFFTTLVFPETTIFAEHMPDLKKWKI